MPLPHFTQIRVNDTGGVGSKPHEPVYLNLFEINFILPAILQQQGRDPILMLESATSIDLDLTPKLDVKEQQFKYSGRGFVTMPEKTTKEFSVKFNVNVNENFNMETWTTLKAWYDLLWNSQTGELKYKADTIGTIIVNQHDRKGRIIRRVTYNNVQILGISSINLDWTTNDIWNEVSADFFADYWIDEYEDGAFTIEAPIIGGY